MADRYQIHFAERSDQLHTSNLISHIGGIHRNGTYWRLAIKDVIAGIEFGEWNFFIEICGCIVDVMLAQNSKGEPYIKTRRDHKLPFNLLRLPDCPV